MSQAFRGIIHLYGIETFEIFQKSHVMIIGLGGVGSWAAESLVRSGVGTISLVDMDDVCVTNINRQLQALNSSIGKPKVEVLASRLQDINPQCKINIVYDFVSECNAQDIIKDVDFCFDAIDSLSAKCLIFKICTEKKIGLLVSGSSAGKKNPSLVSIKDMARTEHDKLLARMRKKMKSDKILPPYKQKKIFTDCVSSSEESVFSSEEICERKSCTEGLGSSSCVTGAFGLHAASYVLDYLVKKNEVH